MTIEILPSKHKTSSPSPQSSQKIVTMEGVPVATIEWTPELAKLVAEENMVMTRTGFNAVLDNPSKLKSEVDELVKRIRHTGQKTDEARDAITGMIIQNVFDCAIDNGNMEAVRTLKGVFPDFDARCNRSLPLHILARAFVNRAEDSQKDDVKGLFPLNEEEMEKNLPRNLAPRRAMPDRHGREGIV